MEPLAESDVMAMNTLLFGEMDFHEDSEKPTVFKESHSKKKQASYEKHLALHSDKEFMKKQWKARKDRGNKKLDGLSKEEKFVEREGKRETVKEERARQLQT